MKQTEKISGRDEKRPTGGSVTRYGGREMRETQRGEEEVGGGGGGEVANERPQNKVGRAGGQCSASSQRSKVMLFASCIVFGMREG